MNSYSDKTMPPPKINSLRILGTRGIPATHGGFETFAQHLAQHLTESGWSVTVYCQIRGEGTVVEEEWSGVRLVKIPESRLDALGTMRFDWNCIKHASKEDGLVLTLGYNTALFNLWFRIKKIKNIINMDGFEWKRTKWSFPARVWFYLNDWAGCLIGNHLIADHPEIAKHLATRRSKNAIAMIPYGANLVESPSPDCLNKYGIEPEKFALCVARAEPENSLLEIVRAFSYQERNQKLVVLGTFNPGQNKYHARVLDEANESVLFLGGIYDKETVEALRFNCSLYVHGHTVGGTNPSLVEALGAGSPILAQNNRFNRWVAGDSAAYFSDEISCRNELDRLLENKDSLKKMALKSKDRFIENFQWVEVLKEYTELLTKMYNQ